MFDKINLNYTQEMTFFGDSKKTWERFYDEYDRWSRYGEHDRDSFRIKYDNYSDTHRGPVSGPTIF